VKYITIGMLLGAATLAQAASVTTTMLDNAAKDTSSVLSSGMGSEGQRYSLLKQINTQNISRLVPAWSFSFGGEKQRGQESQPLIYNGKMFVTRRTRASSPSTSRPATSCGSTSIACRTPSCLAVTWSIAARRCMTTW